MRVWFDCSAAAHPVVLRPVIERFRERGDEVLVTARAYGQTEGILDLLGIEYLAVGRHGGASSAGKAWALARRSVGLLGPVRRFRPDLAVGHGSVDLAIVSRILGIPSVQLQDYEFAGLQRQLAFRAAKKVLVPESIPVERMARVGAGPGKLVRYPGLKEDYYLADFEPDQGLLERMGIDPARILVVVRPPPETSEYHEENPVHEAVMRRLATAEGVTCVFIPRTDRQALEVRAIGSENVIVPDRAIDAQSLIAAADLVISAGGTMNREAVALGTPVYSTFAGRVGGVDEALIAEGRLGVLEDPSAIALVKKSGSANQREFRDPSILVEGILSALN